jgi:hypothetical protein
MSTTLLAREADTRVETDVCEHCRWGGACIPLADLHCLWLHRPVLEADYGWDIFGFTAEAKQQYRQARARGCRQLPKMRQQAELLAEYVDFENLS